MATCKSKSIIQPHYAQENVVIKLLLPAEVALLAQINRCTCASLLVVATCTLCCPLWTFFFSWSELESGQLFEHLVFVLALSFDDFAKIFACVTYCLCVYAPRCVFMYIYIYIRPCGHPYYIASRDLHDKKLFGTIPASLGSAKTLRNLCVCAWSTWIEMKHTWKDIYVVIILNHVVLCTFGGRPKIYTHTHTYTMTNILIILCKTLRMWTHAALAYSLT